MTRTYKGEASVDSKIPTNLLLDSPASRTVPSLTVSEQIAFARGQIVRGDPMSLMPDLIRRLFGYMKWADEVMLDASRTVSDHEYYRPRGFSHGSIHGLLVHEMAAQDVWLRRWQGDGEAAIETGANYPTRADLVAQWPEVHSSLFGFLERQTDET